MEYKKNIEEVLKRYKAFWKKDVYDRPPIRIRFPVEGETEDNWTSAVLNHDTHFDYWDNILSQRAVLGDDEVPTATVDMGPAFMGGVMGAPVYFGKGTSWNEHILKDWSDLDRIRNHPIDDSNPWIKTLKERLNYFIEKSKGKCAVGVAMLTGTGDIMTALRGPTEFCMDLCLYSDEVRELGKICTDAFIKVANMEYDMIPALDGGYCDNYGIWTPGRSSYFADDISTLISPRQYMEQLYPFDCEIAASYDTPWLHVHSQESRLVPEFVKIPGLVGIQVVNDRPAGPTLKEVLPNIKKIQENHCLLLRKYTIDELIEIFPEISPKGLLIDTQCGSLEEAREILKDWNSGKFFKGRL